MTRKLDQNPSFFNFLHAEISICNPYQSRIIVSDYVVNMSIWFVKCKFYVHFCHALSPVFSVSEGEDAQGRTALDIGLAQSRTRTRRRYGLDFLKIKLTCRVLLE